MKIVCVSDPHGIDNFKKVQVPNGDMLIIAGDLCRNYTRNRFFDAIKQQNELVSWEEYLSSLPHKYKVIIAGNHDFALEQDYRLGKKMRGVNYLVNESIVIEGLKFYGFPFTPEFCGWAFMLERDSPQMDLVVSKIPADTDILISHGPPKKTLDNCRDGHVGCGLLRKKISQMNLKLLVCGHIHDDGGKKMKYGDGWIVNAALVNNLHKIVNEPIVVEI